MMIDTGFDADAGAGAPPGSGHQGLPMRMCGGRATSQGQQSFLTPLGTPMGSGGMRRITTWLQATSPNGTSRRQKLMQEHEELKRRHRAEQSSAEELQARLSLEMRELRDQCHGHSQTVGQLTQRLSDARDAVHAELRASASVKSALCGELASEESRRRALEAAYSSGEAELEAQARVESAQRQLAMMRAVRDALESQICTTLQLQDELEHHISAERGGCSELQVAGERELVEWNKHKHQTTFLCELGSRLQMEREEVESEQSVTSQAFGRCQQEHEEQAQDKDSLVAQLASVREAQDRIRSELHGGATAWTNQVEHLHERISEADEECWQSLDAAQRNRSAISMCSVERALLEEEIEQSDTARQVETCELEAVEQQSAELTEELHQLREALLRCQEDDEKVRLCHEQDSLSCQLHDEAEARHHLESELEALKNSRGLLCWRRRAPASPTAGASPPPHHAAPGKGCRDGRGGKGKYMGGKQGYPGYPGDANARDVGGLRDEV